MEESNTSSCSGKSCPSRTNSTRKLLSKLLRHKSRSRSVPPVLNKLPPIQRKSFEEPTENYLIVKSKNIQGKKSRRNSGPSIPSQDFSIKHGFFANSNANLSLVDSLFRDHSFSDSSQEFFNDGTSKSEAGSNTRNETVVKDKKYKIFSRGITKNDVFNAIQNRKMGIPSSSSVTELDQKRKIHSKAMRSKSDHNVRDYVSLGKASSEKSSRTSSSASLVSFKLSPPETSLSRPKNIALPYKECPRKSVNIIKNEIQNSEENNSGMQESKNTESEKERAENETSVVLRTEDMSPSMDSLAKQALLAAKVLHLIPANKARERNYLHGRIAAMSLMGPLELEKVLPCREVTIFVGTWNMNGQAPPKELNDFLLPESLEHVPDVVAIGTQESFPERFEWEVSLQETLGPSHVLLHSTSLGTLHLAVFVRRDLLWFCSVAEDASMSTRPGTAFRTKGAIAIGFLLFGTSFLFLTSHLTAHTERFKDRINDIRRITTSIDLPKLLPVRQKSRDISQNFDCAFWCGDLNFRLEQPREEVMEWIVSQQFPSKEPLQLPSDQLQRAISEGFVLKSFGEAAITFPPTYKFDPGTDHFDSSSKMRTPSYTDRILFKPSCRDDKKSSSTVECLHYYSAHSIRTSDHKPVWSLFRAAIRPGKDTVPLAAGLFNREVYLEGIKRRAAAIDSREGYSTVCSIQ